MAASRQNIDSEPDDRADEMLPDESTIPTFVGINLYGVQIRDEDYGEDDELHEGTQSQSDSTAIIAHISQAGSVESIVEVQRIQEPAADAAADVEQTEVRGVGNLNRGIIQEGSNVDPLQNPASEGANVNMNHPIPITMVEGPDIALHIDPLCHGYDIKDQLKGRVRTSEPGSPEYYTLIRR
jgi:hypothetical protein